MKPLWNRRQFLLTASAVTSGALVGSSFLRPINVAAAAFIRKDVGNLTAADSTITSYAKAVKAMQLLPTSDPRSWAYQAAIHGTMTSCPVPPGPCPTSWNTCEHGTQFFWSWHRMYLYYFEKIVRHMSGDYGWALPYWNWQLASERTLPPMFRDPASALYTSNRNPAINSGAGSLPGTDVDCSVAFADLAYNLAVLDIQAPHGHVHIDVGGWMTGVSTSAQDPIFYLHHSNVDRLWNLWLAKGGGRTDPLTDSAWKAKTYTFFDENGTAVTMKDCDVLRAAQQLNYTYEGEPPQVNEYCLIKIKIPPYLLQIVQLIHFPLPPVEINSEPVSVPIELGNRAAEIQKVAQNPNLQLLLVLDGVEVATQPGVTYQVYLGLPAGAQAVSDSPSYLGTFSLFGLGVRDEAHNGFTPASFHFKANRALLAALRAKRALTLTIVPSGILIDGKPSRPQSKSTLRIGSISLSQGKETREPQKAQPPTT